MPDNHYVLQFLNAWVASLAIEIAVLCLYPGVLRQSQLTQVITAGVVATSLTIPWLWFVLPIGMSWQEMLVAGEFLVVLVETYVIKNWLKLPLLLCLCAVFTANLVSLVLGILVS